MSAYRCTNPDAHRCAHLSSSDPSRTQAMDRLLTVGSIARVSIGIFIGNIRSEIVIARSTTSAALVAARLCSTLNHYGIVLRHICHSRPRKAHWLAFRAPPQRCWKPWPTSQKRGGTQHFARLIASGRETRMGRDSQSPTMYVQVFRLLINWCHQC